MFLTKKMISLLPLVAFASAAHAVGTITPKDAAAKVQAGKAVLIDVRETDEIQFGKAAPAISLPTSEVQAQDKHYQQVVASLKPNQEVIVYCASGGRAGKVGAELEKKGFKVDNMGGFSGWQKAGLPVSKP